MEIDKFKKSMLGFGRLIRLNNSTMEELPGWEGAENKLHPRSEAMSPMMTVQAPEEMTGL
ncbi:hypothetical protein GCM10027454_17460 [Algoriphagus aestuariicola]